MTEHRVTILYLDMNSYFASVAQREEPALRGRPVGIVTTLNDGAACIAASYDAKARGIGVGTRMRDAKAMCPGIVFRPARHDVYVQYHHRIKDAIERVIPVSGTHSVDEFSCIIPPSVQDLPKAIQLAETARQSIYTNVGEALRCSIGLGTSTLLAKLAGELQKPDGLEWLVPEVMPEKIAHLRLKDLPGIGWRMEPRLHAAGISDIRTLYAMEPRHARRVWGGVQGERFLRALQGEDIPDPTTKAHSFAHGQMLTPVNRTPQGARLVSRRLLIKAATRLRRAEYFATYIRIWLKCGVRGRYNAGGSMPATQDSFRLLEIFHSLWNTMEPVKPFKVGVMLGGLVPKHEHIPDLFETRDAPGAQTERERLCSLVDKINQKYGSDTIIYGEKPIEMVPYSGAKIAFGRIPEIEEFQD